MAGLMTKILLQKSDQQQKKIYQKLFLKSQHSLKSLHCFSKENQTLRFKTLALIGNLEGCKILDIGCGFGDFFLYLANQKIYFQGIGYDIIKEFVTIAQQQNPSHNFFCENILKNPPDEKFDFVFSSGIYAFGNQTFFREMTKLAFLLSRKGYAFNIHESQGKKFLKLDRKEAYQFCETLSPKKIEIIEEEKLPNDYTVFLYR